MALNAATIDSKGRVSFPREIREELGLVTGDTLFFKVDRENNTVQVAKAINPLDILAEMANQEFERGETMSLRDFAKEMGINLDEP